MFKKLVAVLLSLSFVIASFSLAVYSDVGLFSWIKARAADEFYSSPYHYSINSDGEATITSVDTDILGAVFIPDYLNGYPVVGIDDYAFENCIGLKSVEIPDSVKSIDETAFAYCYGLEEFSVSNNSPFRIVNEALCSSDTVLFLPRNSSLTEYHVSGFERIGEFAFFDCDNLEYIYIDEIAERAYISSFVACDNLKGFVVDSENEYFCSDENGALYNLNGNSMSLCSWPVKSSAKTIVLPEGCALDSVGAFFGKYEAELVITDDMFAWAKEAVINYGYDISTLYEMVYSFFATSAFESFYVPESNDIFSSEDGLLYNKDKTILIKYPIASNRTYVELAVNAIPYQYAFCCSDFTKQIAYSGNEEAFVMPSDLTVHVSDEAINLILDENSYFDSFLKFLGVKTICTDVSSEAVSEANENIQRIFNRIGGFSDEYIDKLRFTVVNCEGIIPTVTGVCGDNLIWSLNETTGELVISGTGDMYDFNNMYSNYAPWRSYINTIKTVKISDGVTSIGSFAFTGLYNIVSMELPDSLNSIGDCAFWGCESLKSIEIPEGVISIGYLAFADCTNIINIELPNSLNHIGQFAFSACLSLTSIEIPEGVTSIGSSAFSNCPNIVSVELPDSLKSIGQFAFSDCNNLTDIEIPRNVSEIGIGVFMGCLSLEHISVDENNKHFSNDEYGVLFNKDKTVILAYPSGLYQEYIVPDSVKYISDYAFYNALMHESIGFLPEGLLHIGAYAFGNCFISEILIPSTVTYIGQCAFGGCNRFTVSEDNLYYSSDEHGVLFNKDKTVLINFPSGSQLESYSIPDSVLEIKLLAFCSSYLTEIILPDGLEKIGHCSFGWCSNLKEIIIPDSVTCIESQAFYECPNLETAVLPEGIDYIESDIFGWCTNLKSVIIPDSVTMIGYDAFNGCENLKDVYFKGTQEEWGSILINDGNAPLYNATVTYNYLIGSAILSENVVADCGETVSIPVKITNNPGMMGFSVILDYDETVMTPISVKAGDILEGGTLNDSIGGSLSAGKVKVAYYADYNINSDGTLFTVDFAIKENVSGKYNIGVSYIQDDTFNEDFEDVVLSCKGSTVMIEDPSERGKAKFYVDDMQVNAGDEIIVPVNVYVGSEGLSDFELTLSYNSDVFTYKGYGANFNVLSISEDSENGTVDFTVGSMHIPGDWDYEVAYFIFTVKDYIECTETISVSCSNAYYNSTQIETICKNGKITITNPHADEPAIIYSDDYVVANNGYIDVPVYINNNHGVMGFGMNVSYDSGILEPVSVSKGTILSNGSFDNNIGKFVGNFRVLWNNTEDMKDNGLLFTVRFKIISEEIPDEVMLYLSYSQPDTYNENWEDVVFDMNISSMQISREYTATFVAEGVVVSTQKFTLATEKLDEPDIPQKAGYIARWEPYELKAEDIVINAKYDPYQAIMFAKRSLKVDDEIRLVPSCNFDVTRKVWSSSNNSVAIVDNRGNVTAVGEGECIIKVTCYGFDSSGNEVSATAATKIAVTERFEAGNLKEKFREAFDEFFSVKIYDFLENLKNIFFVIFKLVY